MEYRKLGNSDLEVSEISLGSWLTYGVGVEAEQTRACLDRAFDLGINFIDTANVYGRGKAETVLGEMLAGRARDSYILATKLYFPMSDTDKGLSRAQILKQIDASLERLRTDYVDLYQCHRYDPDTPLEETMQALTEIVQAGKVRYIGFSEWTPDQIAPYIVDVLRIFGPARCMMGTDWPVSLLASDYGRTVDLVRDAIAGLDEKSQYAVLWGAAVDAYRLDEGRL